MARSITQIGDNRLALETSARRLYNLFASAGLNIRDRHKFRGNALRWRTQHQVANRLRKDWASQILLCVPRIKRRRVREMKSETRNVYVRDAVRNDYATAGRIVGYATSIGVTVEMGMATVAGNV